MRYNKILIIVSIVVIFGFVPVFFSFAQNDPIQQLQETISQLEERIAQLQTQMQELKSQEEALMPQSIPAVEKLVFVQILKKGSKGEGVTKLQEYLARFADIYPEGLITGYFGTLTEAAVKRFQEKYAGDILTPLGLAEGTGYVGEATIAKLNELTSGEATGEEKEELIVEELIVEELIVEELIVEELIVEEVIEEAVVEEAPAAVTEAATTTNDVADTVSPANVTNLNATVDVGRAVFSWVNPADDDFAGVKIIRKWWSEPRDIDDGIQIYDGKATSTADSGLAAGIAYYYKFFTYDEVPNYSSGAILKFTSTSTLMTIASVNTSTVSTGGGSATASTGAVDTTSPTISNFQPSGTTTDTTPTISLNTNETASCRYASTTDRSYDAMAGVFNSADGLYHYSTLDQMATGTFTYYARCQDAADNQTSSSTSVTFIIAVGIADTTAPIISNIQTSGITASSSIITWQTNEESDSLVYYGPTPAYGSTASGAMNATYHQVALSNLTSNTTYHYKVASTDNSGNKTESQDKTFTTLVLDTTSPSISNIQASNITQTSAAITWTTNESSNSKVSYSLTSPIANPTTITDSGNVTSHTINLTDLAANTTYYYTVASADASSNAAVSSEQSFTTLPTQSLSGNTGSMDLMSGYLSIPHPQQTGLDLSSQFTIEAWVNTNGVTNGSQIYNTFVSRMELTGGGDCRSGYSFQWQSSYAGSLTPALTSILACQYEFDSITFGSNTWRTFAPNPGEWVHIALVYNAPNDIFYINGVGGGGNLAGNPSSQKTATFYIGATEYAGSGGPPGLRNVFQGKMDEVRVWNVARTETEIQQNYNKELTGSEPGLVAYWKFNNELVGDKAKDETSNHNDLTLNNSPLFSPDTPF